MSVSTSPCWVGSFTFELCCAGPYGVGLPYLGKIPFSIAVFFFVFLFLFVILYVLTLFILILNRFIFSKRHVYCIPQLWIPVAGRAGMNTTHGKCVVAVLHQIFGEAGYSGIFQVFFEKKIRSLHITIIELMLKVEVWGLSFVIC